MAKQLNIEMDFSANTAKAKQAIQELQTSIQKLGYGAAPSNGIVDPKKFQEASAAARELSRHLNNAYNTKTGNLDIGKLSASLSASRTSLSALTSSFKDAGSTGQQAFVSLAKAIANADYPTLSINSHLSTMFTTLKNVARFQISSSIMHGLIGGIQTAYGYAQDLNESLNNIRIVTGQSTTQMAQFAKEANEAARSLSATTLDYTNAALIYYQQGLSAEDVKARTDVTVKLANVSRQSSEEVSSQMTAIWNNFDQGSHSMEYFADVITALGATTASSSEEIAHGLQQFAPIAGTIGLSYEKASAALAAIVANTRQSAETVGTGLRTIFSRFESLKLGDTLEDGVDLNKYTKAMQTIGVNVLDANGKLREMDDILDDVAEHWEQLDNTQKTAFATTVGGVRQYTNLMALFDNWDDVQKNMTTAMDSEGTLSAQSDIYAESWEAARDRVKTAAESLYGTLIDEDFFIGIDNLVEHILTGIKKFLDGFGGLKSLIVSILSFTLSMTANKIEPALQRMVQNIQIMTGGADKVYSKMQKQIDNTTEEQLASGNYTESETQELRNAQQLSKIKSKLALINDQLTDSEREYYNQVIENIQRQQNHLVELQKQKEKAIEDQDKAYDKLNVQNQLEDSTRIQERAQKQRDAVPDVDEDFSFEDQSAALEQIWKSAGQAEEVLTQAREKILTNFKQGVTDSIKISDLFNFESIDSDIDSLIQQLENGFEGINTDEIFTDSVIDSLSNFSADEQFAEYKDFAIEIENLIDQDSLSSNQITKILEQINSMAPEAQSSLAPLVERLKELQQTASNYSSFDEFKNHVMMLGESFGDIGDLAPQLKQALDQISKANTPDDMRKGLLLLQKAMEEGEISAEQYGTALKKLGLSDNVVDDLVNARASIEDLDETIQENSEALNNNADIDFTHTVSGIEAITQTAAGLGQLVTTFNAIKSAITTLGDDSATTGQKLTALTGAMVVGIPSAIGAFDKLRTGIIGTKTALAAAQTTYTALTAIQGLLTAGWVEGAAAAGAEAGAVEVSTGTKIADLLISKGLIVAKNSEAAAALKAAIATDLDAAAKANNGKLTLKQIIETVMGTVAKETEAGAHLSNAAALIAETAAAMGLNTAMLPLWAIILIITAALAALVLVVYGVVKAFSAEADALKASNEAVSNAAKAYDEAKKAHEEFKNSLSDYQDAINNLNSLVKGTDEYREAVEKANESARALIDANDELQGKYHYNASTGAIEFDEGALENLEASQARKLDAAQEAYLTTKNGNLQLKNDQALAKASRQDDTKDYMKGIGSALTTTLVAGVLNPLLLPFVGVTSLLSKSITGFINNANKNDAQQDALQAFADATNKYGNITLESAKEMGLLSDSQYELISSLGMTESELHNLATEINANTAAILQNNKQIVDNALTGNKAYEESENKDALNTILAQQYNKKEQSLYDTKYSDKAGKLTDKVIQQLYAEQMGYTWSKNKGNNLGEYIDQSGQTITISDETARRYLASQEALIGLTDSITNADNALSKLQEGTDIVSQALYSKATNGDFSGVDIVSDADKEKTYTTAELQGDLTDEEFAAIYESLGYTSANEFTKAFNLELSNQLASVSDVVATIKLSDDIKNTLSEQFDDILSGMTAGGAQNFANNLNNLITSFGEDVGVQFTDLVSDITKNMSKEEKDIFLKEFGKIKDFRDIDAWDNFLKSMKDSGKISEQTAASLEQYVATAKDVANATSKINFDDFCSKIKSLNDLIKQINEGNREFSEEDYNTLIANGANENDFARTIDGTYRYLGSMEELASSLQATADTALTAALDNLTQLSEACNQAATNAGLANTEMMNVSESTLTAASSTLELTESQKFMLLISNIFRSLVERISTAVHSLGEIASTVFDFIKNAVNTYILEPFFGVLNAIYDGIIGLINGIKSFLNGIIGTLNKTLEFFHLGTISTIEYSQTSGERAEMESAKQQAEESAEAQSSAHDEFMAGTAEVSKMIETSGSTMTEDQMDQILTWIEENSQATADKIADAQAHLNEAEEGSAEAEYWATTLEQAQAEAEAVEQVATAYENAGRSAVIMAESVGQIQDATTQFNLTEEQTLEAYKTLAQSTDEGKAALKRYKAEMEGVEEGSEEAKQATARFVKTMKDIQANKAAKAIHEIWDNLDELSDWDAEQIAKELQSVFGKEITGEWVKNHQDLVDQWLNGTDEQRQAAADAMETMTDMQDWVGNLDLSTEVYIGADGSEVALTADQVETYKQIIADNPPTVDVDGHADMSGVVEELMRAGMTAEQVANLLASVGQTDVEFKAGSFNMRPFPKDGTPDEVTDWMHDFAAMMNNQGMDVSHFDVPSGGTPEMTSGGGGKGGGGGGKSSSKKHDKKETDTGTRYHTIQQQQADNDRNLTMAQERAERSFGKTRIKNLQDQIKLQKEAVSLQQKYLQKINNYLTSDREDLTQFFEKDLKDIIKSAPSFDPTTGIITNYENIEKELLEWYNKQADKEMDDEAWKKVEEKYNNALKKIKQYEETLKLSKDEAQKLIEKNNELADQMLEMAEYKVEIKIELDDDDLSLLDYMLNKIDDDAYRAGEAIALLGDKTGKLLDKQQIYENGINEILGNHGTSLEKLGKNNLTSNQLMALGLTDKEKETLREYRDELIGIAEELDELQDDIINKVIDSFDELNSKVQDSYDFFSHYNDILESYRNIADLNRSAIGKEAQTLIKNLDDSMLKNSKNALRSSKLMYDELTQARIDAENKLNEAKDAGIIGDITKYQEVLENIDEQIRDAQEQWLTDWEDGLSRVQDILKRSVEDAVANFEQMLSPLYGSLDFLEQAYEMNTEMDSRYLKDYQRLYEVSKINRNINKELENIQGKQSRDRLLAFQKELNVQNQQGKMTEYNVEQRQKELDLLMARIALEESQDAKHMVRLQRDNEGNWGYVYTLDDDDLEEKQQDVEDKLFAYEDFIAQSFQGFQDSGAKLAKSLAESIKEIASDPTLTYAEKMARLAQVREKFLFDVAALGEDVQSALADQSKYSSWLNELYNDPNASILTNFNESILGKIFGTDSIDKWIDQLINHSETLFNAAQDSAQTYSRQLDEMNAAAGSSTSTLTSDIGEAEAEIDEASRKNVANIETLANTMSEGLSKALTAAIDQEREFGKKIADTTAEIEKQALAINKLIRGASNLSGATESLDLLKTAEDNKTKYGIQQPSYNEDDWTANKNIDNIFSDSADTKYTRDELTVIDNNSLNKNNPDFDEYVNDFKTYLLENMDSILNTIDLNSNVASQGLGTISTPSLSSSDQVIQQDIHIDANFPSVTQSSEIEEAFENLVNKAAQFAHRKRQG